MLHGKNFVAGDLRSSATDFRAHDAASNDEVGPVFYEATDQDVADACKAAASAQATFGSLEPSSRAAFIRLVADKIDSLGDTLTQRAMLETGLPQARLEGERGRTVGQLRLFADVVEKGGWQRARIDHADPDRTPPKPDLRLQMIPLGPVAVFGASNFPLAFSVAGGDTASAFAAGCCVVVKAHPAHPGTSELVAGAITEAVAECGLPSGVFSLLHGKSNSLGEALVKDPRIAAVGFTGSRAGGLALMQHAASRDVPVPVYAEMSSVNPVILLPNKLEASAEDLATAYVGSLSLGAGQFCTNPGILIAIGGSAFDRFLSATISALANIEAQPMLTARIRENFEQGVSQIGRQAGAQLVGLGKAGRSSCGQAQAYATTGDVFLANPQLGHEVFGPSSIIVKCNDIAQVRAVLSSMEGQLTATLHMNAEDYPAAAGLLPVLEKLAGRVIANGWPTGVDVTHAMVHGGPFPATSDGRSTSVGTLAIERFLRPVCYQDMPDELLPAVLRENGSGGLRMIDGEMQR